MKHLMLMFVSEITLLSVYFSQTQTISEHLRKICAKSLTKPDVVQSDWHSSHQLSPAMDSTDHRTNNNNNSYAVTQSNGVVCEGWLTKSPPEKIWKTVSMATIVWQCKDCKAMAMAIARNGRTGSQRQGMPFQSCEGSLWHSTAMQ